MVSAHLLSEENGVPIDQIMYKETDNEIVLVLYPGKYLLQFDDGKVKKTTIVEVE